MLIFRAISENTFGWNNKNSEELLNERSLMKYLECLNIHLTKGNFDTNDYWTSFSKNFRIAYYYSKPSIYRGSRNDKRCQRNVKIGKSNIICCEFDEGKMVDITDKESIIVKEYCKRTAYNYGKSNEEVLLLGNIEEFIEFTLFECDLIYILSEKKEKYDVKFHINNVINTVNNVEYKIELDFIERIVYELLYNCKKNLYEIIAPLYYSNNVDIKYIYGLILNIIKSILNKAISFIDSGINVKYETIIKMYKSQLNFICLKYNQYNYCNEECNFNILFKLYDKELKDITIDNKELSYKIDKTYSIRKLHYITDVEYPIFLYLPRNEKIFVKDYFEFDEKRDLFFEIEEYKVYRNNCVVEKNYNGYRNYRYMLEGSRYGYTQLETNICKFVSEIYIPHSYLEIEDNVFDIEESFSNRKNIENKYCDLLIRVFGGYNLKNYNISFKNREFIKKIE